MSICDYISSSDIIIPSLPNATRKLVKYQPDGATFYYFRDCASSFCHLINVGASLFKITSVIFYDFILIVILSFGMNGMSYPFSVKATYPATEPNDIEATHKQQQSFKNSLLFLNYFRLTYSVEDNK